MKVSLDDIRNIKSGTTVTFTVDHPKRIESVKAMAYMLNSQEPELKKRYTCKSDYAHRQVTVTANPIK